MENLMNLVLTRKFDTTSCEFYQNENEEVWLTREQIGKALGYANPGKAIQKIHLEHKERLDKFSIQIKEETINTLNIRNRKGSDSGVLEEDSRLCNLRSTVTYYSERGIMEICRWSEMPRADEFMDWVYDVIQAYRHREYKLALQDFDSKLENLNKRLLDLEKEKMNKSAFAEDCEPYFKTLIAYYGRNPKSPARYFANKESITEFVINEMEKDYADFNWERVKREYVLTYRCTLPRDIFAIFEGLKDYQMRFLLTLEAMAERKEVTNALSVE